MKRPLAGLVVTYASGIWIGSLIGGSLTPLLLTVVGCLVLFWFLRGTRFSRVVLLGAVFLLGMAGYRRATIIFSPIDIARVLELRDQNATVRGLIVTDTEERAAPSGGTYTERIRFCLDVRALQRMGEWTPATGTILVFVSDTNKVERLRYGDLIQFSGVLRVPTSARNPGVFDWRGWLEQRGIHFTATIRKEDLLEVEGHNHGDPIIAASFELGQRIEHALRIGLEGEPKLAGALAGMVIGERSEIPTETYKDFQRTGVFHVFAINGLHVGLVTGILFIALRLVRIPRRWRSLATVPLIFLYVFATGAHPGALRAAIMASAVLIGWTLVRPTDVLNSLAGAALVILLCDPMQLFSSGFQLSFAVVLAIVVLTPRIEARLLPWIATDPFLPEEFVPLWRKKLGRWLRWLIGLLSCSIAAWLGLVPLMALYFNLFTPISILANLVVIPLLGCIIALGLLAALASVASVWLAATLNSANSVLIAVMVHGVDWLGAVPFGHWFVGAPPVWLVWTYYALGMVALVKWISLRHRRLIAVVAMCAICAPLFLGGRSSHEVEITVLSLTDGASIFVREPGHNDLLIDGGGGWDATHIVVPFLRSEGVNRLGAMVLTCGDKAHAEGLTAVAEEIPAREAVWSGIISRSKYCSKWVDQIKKRKIPLLAVQDGDDISLVSNVQIRVLNPPPGVMANRADDNSLVLAIEYGPSRVLLTSDAGATVEKHLLRNTDDAELRAEVIVKGQHGKESSSTDEFLDAVHPETVVQVVNVGDSHRYPEPALRDRCAQRGIAYLRTDDAGAVTIRLTGKGCEARTFLK
ncbi:MAG TPA: DNA internalization-related competence protein ComEC/Rec2 [Verrucomicrobiae bacterium]|nr:DNA internalization-related competence protein ComEC/Rec2 [Verrucomicrobiae bacterium]